MSEQTAPITDEQKQALQMVSDCGWGVKVTDGVSLIEVPQNEGEYREIVDVVFGLPMDGSGAHLPSGQSVEALALAFEALERGWYVVQVPAERAEGFGFDEDEGEMGSLEAAELIEVRGPMSQPGAVSLYAELGGE